MADTAPGDHPVDDKVEDSIPKITLCLDNKQLVGGPTAEHSAPSCFRDDRDGDSDTKCDPKDLETSASPSEGHEGPPCAFLPDHRAEYINPKTEYEMASVKGFPVGFDTSWEYLSRELSSKLTGCLEFGDRPQFERYKAKTKSTSDEFVLSTAIGPPEVDTFEREFSSDKVPLEPKSVEEEESYGENPSETSARVKSDEKTREKNASVSLGGGGQKRVGKGAGWVSYHFADDKLFPENKTFCPDRDRRSGFEELDRDETRSARNLSLSPLNNKGPIFGYEETRRLTRKSFFCLDQVWSNIVSDNVDYEGEALACTESRFGPTDTEGIYERRRETSKTMIQCPGEVTTSNVDRQNESKNDFEDFEDNYLLHHPNKENPIANTTGKRITSTLHENEEFVYEERKEIKRVDHLATEHAEHLATEQVQHLATEHEQHLSTSYVQHLATEHVQHLATELGEHLATEHLQHLATEHVQHLATELGEHLATEQVQHLATVQVQQLATEQVQHLATEHEQHLSTSYVQHLATEHVQHLATELGEHLATEHVQHLATKLGEHLATEHVDHLATEHVQHLVTELGEHLATEQVVMTPENSAKFELRHTQSSCFFEPDCKGQSIDDGRCTEQLNAGTEGDAVALRDHGNKQAPLEETVELCDRSLRQATSNNLSDDFLTFREEETQYRKSGIISWRLEQDHDRKNTRALHFFSTDTPSGSETRFSLSLERNVQEMDTQRSSQPESHLDPKQLKQIKMCAEDFRPNHHCSFDEKKLTVQETRFSDPRDKCEIHCLLSHFALHSENLRPNISVYPVHGRNSPDPLHPESDYENTEPTENEDRDPPGDPERFHAPQQDPPGASGREGERPAIHDDGPQVVSHGTPNGLPHPPYSLERGRRQGESGRAVICIDHFERRSPDARRLPGRRIPTGCQPCRCAQCLLVHLRANIGLPAVAVPFPTICQEVMKRMTTILLLWLAVYDGDRKKGYVSAKHLFHSREESWACLDCVVMQQVLLCINII